jgi:hypothetical protein
MFIEKNYPNKNFVEVNKFIKGDKNFHEFFQKSPNEEKKTKISIKMEIEEKCETVSDTEHTENVKIYQDENLSSTSFHQDRQLPSLLDNMQVIETYMKMIDYFQQIMSYQNECYIYQQLNYFNNV